MRVAQCSILREGGKKRYIAFKRHLREFLCHTTPWEFDWEKGVNILLKRKTENQIKIKMDNFFVTKKG